MVSTTAQAVTSGNVRLAGRWAVFVVVWAVLGGAVPVLLLVEIPDAGRSVGWVFTLVLMVWSGARLAHRIANGRPDLFDFVFWLFAYVFMGLAPTAQMRADQVSTTTAGMDPAHDVRTAVAVWVGVVCYEIGHAWSSHRGHRRELDACEDEGLDARPGAAVALTAVGVLAALYYVSRIGLGTLFMNRYDAFSVRSDRMPDVATRSIVSAAGSYPLLIAIGVYLRVWMTKALGDRSRTYLPVAAVAAVVLLVVVNPISSARYDFGTVAFALVVFLGAMSTTRRARIAMAGTVAAFLFVFPVADAFRSSTVNVTRNGFFGEYLGNADYDAFWQVGNSLSYLDEGLVQPLRQAAGVVLFWVPRGVWPDKPEDTGVMLSELLLYIFTKLAAPLLAEMNVNGCYVLLALGFLTLGVGLERLDRRIARALLHGGILWGVVGAVFPFYMVILLRGSMLQATGTFVVAIASVLVVRRRRAGPERRRRW